MIKIAPSILSADFSKLGEEIKRLEEAGADWVHIDVMDGHFVPNITIGPPVVKSLRQHTGLVFDVHLMIENPDNYIDSFIDAGADVVTVHAETCPHLHRTLQKIRQRGKKAGVALNPGTPLNMVEWVLKDLDLVLIMTVNPGFGGQAFIEGMVDKIKKLKEMIDQQGSNAKIQVDGGIGADNAGTVAQAGAEILVAGSSVFSAPDTKEIIEILRGGD